MRQQAQLAARLALKDPALLADYGRYFFQGRKHSPALVRKTQAGAITVESARALLCARFGDWDDGPALDELKEWSFAEAARRGGTANMGGDSALGLVAYWTVRALRPEAVIETGVATGVTSAHVLAALRDNTTGQLHSIDLPPTDMLAGGTVGIAIPDAWKRDWQYHWGSAVRLLPRVLSQTSAQSPRLFVHDSDHSYEHMQWEIRRAWETLGLGDAIICDDVDFHSAFLDTAAEFGADPYLVAQAEKGGTTGIMFR